MVKALIATKKQLTMGCFFVYHIFGHGLFGKEKVLCERMVFTLVISYITEMVYRMN
jgi:hypothetical protein